MWTTNKPTEVGWYFTIIKPKDETGIMAILPVTKLKDVLRIEIGDELIEFNSKEIEIITHWSGPIVFPAITDEIKNEIGEVETIA